jgi:hypothetical protein
MTVTKCDLCEKDISTANDVVKVGVRSYGFLASYIALTTPAQAVSPHGWQFLSFPSPSAQPPLAIPFALGVLALGELIDDMICHFFIINLPNRESSWAVSRPRLLLSPHVFSPSRQTPPSWAWHTDC